MKELVVISGKGGTGKTSVVASLAALAEGAVLADCDVDAPDLHLLLTPRVRRREDFSAGQRARVDAAACTGCGRCADLCRFDAVAMDAPAGAAGEPTARIDPTACEGCGVCERACPAGAVRLEPLVNGQWFVSDTRRGPMVHAALGVAEENSGKLVTVVRRQARHIAAQRRLPLLLTDGSPGIGCPVIASLTGADLALVVTEPSLSALHDLHRVADLTRHFDIDTLVCINKCDLQPRLARRVRAESARRGLPVVGHVRYDEAVTAAMARGLSVVEHGAGPAAEDLRELWRNVADRLGAGPRASERSAGP